MSHRLQLCCSHQLLHLMFYCSYNRKSDQKPSCDGFRVCSVPVASSGLLLLSVPSTVRGVDGAAAVPSWYYTSPMKAFERYLISQRGPEHLDDTMETDGSSLVLIDRVGGTKIGYLVFVSAGVSSCRDKRATICS